MFASAARVARAYLARVNLPPRQWVAVPTAELDADQADSVWTVFSSAYRPVGLAFSSIQGFLAEHKTLWCIDVDGDQRVDAFIAYKVTPSGFKITFVGHDGSTEAGMELSKKVLSTLAKSGWYTELSHKPAKLAESRGFLPLDDEQAVRAILRKDIVWLGNGYYTRNVTGIGVTQKGLYGNPRIP